MDTGWPRTVKYQNTNNAIQLQSEIVRETSLQVQGGNKRFCLDEILTRLCHRKMHPDMLELQKLKELLCKKRIHLARHKKSKFFNMMEMERAPSTLKSGRCRDAHGYTNEIFKQIFLKNYE